jgi:DNA processing protein
VNALEALICLTHIPYLGPVKIKTLIEWFGSPMAALEAEGELLKELPGFGPKIIEIWKARHQSFKWIETIEQAQRDGIQVISYTNPLYPKRLLEVADYPLILYVKGSLKQQDDRSLAIVGTRQATIYGMETARKISGDLALEGFTIVSGLARGIDTAVHEAALQRGRTIAVLGSGFNHLYPKENEGLARQIIQNGALISEFPMSTPPDRQNFPRRNRIVSGMTLGTILIEAPLESGAMITSRQACTLGRPVFALPGRTDQENFRGNHTLIKNQHAQLIENAEDVILHFCDLCAPFPKKFSAPHTIHLEKEEEELIRRLPAEELSIDDICIKMQLPVAKLNVLLMSLVLKKVIKEFPGKIYKKM